MTSARPVSQMRLDRREGLRRLAGALLEDVQTDAGLHADRRHRVSDHVVQLAGDAQPLLGDQAAGPLLAERRLPRELGTRARQQGPVVADRRARAPRGGGEQDRDRHHADGGDIPEDDADRQDLDPGRERRAGQAPAPATVRGEGVAAEQRSQRDEPPGVRPDEPEDDDRVEPDERRDRVSATDAERAGQRRRESERSDVERACVRRRRRADPRERGDEDHRGHRDAETDVHHRRCRAPTRGPERGVAHRSASPLEPGVRGPFLILRVTEGSTRPLGDVLRP